MALRVMQIYIPRDTDKQPDELLEGREVLGRWEDTHKSQTVLHLLVPAEETEPIMDQFESQFAGVDDFHVVLFPVEAVLPRQKREDNGEKQNGKENTDDQEKTSAAPRISREELYDEVSESIGVTRAFIGMTLLSAVVASIGLMRDDVAVIIGAMVIAPLLGPNVAMSLGTTLGDTDLIRRALMTNLSGIVTAFVVAFTVGMMVDVDPEVPAIASRIEFGMGDILLALAAGGAGTIAFTSGLSGAVIGVMVAVALVPPLVVAGMLLGDGQPGLGIAALGLTVSNVICINLAGIGIFLAQGVSPRSGEESKRAQASVIKASIIWTILLGLLVLLIWLISNESLPMVTPG